MKSMRQQGMMHAMRHIEMVLLLQRMAQIYLSCLRKKAKNGAGYELYSNRWLEYAKNGWKKKNDLVLKIGFDSSGLYDIGQEKRVWSNAEYVDKRY